MKKLLTFIMAVVMSLGLAVGLTACGNKGGGGSTSGGGGGDVALALTKDTLFPGLSGTDYKTYNGTHTVGSYTITTTDVLGNTHNTFSVIQFKKQSGVLSVTDKFSKVVIVIESSFPYESNITAYAGGTKLADNLKSTEDSGQKSGNYTVNYYTVEFTITGSGSQLIELKNESGNAVYLTEINFHA